MQHLSLAASIAYFTQTIRSFQRKLISRTFSLSEITDLSFADLHISSDLLNSVCWSSHHNRMSELLGCMSFGLRSLTDADKVSLEILKAFGKLCTFFYSVSLPLCVLDPLDHKFRSLIQCEWIPVTLIVWRKHFRVTSVTEPHYCLKILEWNTVWITECLQWIGILHTHYVNLLEYISLSFFGVYTVKNHDII